MDKELEAIVQRMIDAGESEENIALVIKSYKPLKKKEDSEPTSQENQLESQVQPQKEQGTLDTDAQKKVSASDISTGEVNNIVYLSDEELGIAPIEYEYKPVLDEMGEQVYYTDKESGQLKPAQQKVLKGYASESEYEKARFDALEERATGKAPSKDYENYLVATDITQDDKDNIELEIQDELAGDTLGEQIKSGWNTFADTITTIGTFGSETKAPEFLRANEYPYQKQSDQAKSELIKESDGDENKVTDEMIEERTLDIVRKEKENALKADKNREYLKGLSEEDRKALNIEGVEKYKSITDRNKYLLTKAKLAEGKIKSTQRKKVKAEEIIKSPENFTFDKDVEMAVLENGKKVPVTVLNEYAKIIKESNEQANELNDLANDYITNNEKLGSVEEEVDYLGRIYDTSEKVKSIVRQGGGDFYVNTVYGLPLFMDEVIGGNIIESEESREEAIQKTKEWEEAKELEKSRLYKDVDFNNLSVDNVGEFITQELSTQAPIFIQMALPGGVASLGATSTGDKYSDMILEERLQGKKYSKGEKLTASLGFGLSEAFLGSLPTKNIFSRSINAMSKQGKRELFKSGVSSFYNKAKGNVKDIVKEGLTESITEGLTQVTQNAIDIGVLDKKDVSIFDGVDHAMFSGGLIGAGIRVAPAVTGVIMKPFANTSERNQVTENVKKIFDLQEKLNSGTLDVEARKQVEGYIKTLESENISIIEGIEKKVKNISEESFEAVKDITKKQSTIQAEAEKVKSNTTLDNETKSEILKGLESEFNSLETKRLKIISKDATVLDALPDNEVVRLQDKASRELSKEMKDKGVENFNLTEEQINERAIEIYNNQKQVKQNEKELSEQQRQATSEEIIDAKADESIITEPKDTETEVQEEVEVDEITEKDTKQQEEQEVLREQDEAKVVDRKKKEKAVVKKSKAAVKNIKKGKVGTINKRNNIFIQVASIPFKSIPDSMIDKYNSIIEQLGSRRKVLELEKDPEFRNQVREVIDAVNEENHTIDSLRIRLDNFEGKDKDFNKTVNNMIESGIISAKEGDIMKRRKDSFIVKEPSARKKKETRSLETSSIQSNLPKLNTKGDLSKRQVDNVRKIKSISDADLVGLSDLEITTLNRAINNIIDNDIHPASIQDVLRTVEANRAKKEIKRVSPKLGARWWNIKTNLKTGIKNLFGKPISKAKQRIKQADLASIDTQLNNLKDKTVFKTVFSNLAKANSIFEAKASDVANVLKGVRDKLGNQDKQVESGMKVTMYMIAKYKQSNPEVSSIFSVPEYVKSTLNLPDGKHINQKTRDKLKEVFDSFVDSGVIKGNEVDVDTMYNSLNSKEKNAVIKIREQLDKQADEAYDTNLYDSQNASVFLKDYFPLNTVGTDFNKDLKDKMNQFSNPSFKSKNLQELTATKAHPISFNPFSTAYNSIRGTMFQDAFLHESRVKNKMFNDLLKDESLSSKERGVISDIKEVYDNQLESMVNRNFNTDETGQILNEAASYIAKTGYRVMLAGGVRAGVEFVSNMFAIVASHGDVVMDGFNAITEITGGKFFNKSKELRDFLTNAGASQIDRFTSPTLEKVGRVDFELGKAVKDIGQSNLDSTSKKILKGLYKRTGTKFITDSVAKLHDTLISAPDTVTALPVWMGRFVDEFKKKTGEKPDLDKITNNDREYFDKYHEAINHASTEANKHTKRLASSRNKFEGEVAVDGNSVYQAYKRFNGFFRSFLRNEFISMKEAVHDLVLGGEMTRSEAARLLGGVLARQVFYTGAMQYFGGLVYGGIASAMGYEKDDEVINQEDIDNAKTKEMKELLSNMRGLIKDMEKDYPDLFKIKEDPNAIETTGNALLSTLTGIMTGTGGNAQNFFWNQMAEMANYHYGESVTRDEGEEYNRFDNGLYRTLFPVDEEFDPKDLREGVTKSALGAYSPFIDATTRGNTFDIAGTLGLVPMYKDMKSLKNQLKYKTVRGSKSWYVDKLDLTLSEGIKRLLGDEGISLNEMKEQLREQGVKEKDIDRMSKNMMKLAKNYGILIKEEGN